MIGNRPKYYFTRALQKLGLSDLVLQIGSQGRCVIPNPPLVMKAFASEAGSQEFLSDPSLQAVLKHAKVAKTFWDIGANIGLFSILARDQNRDLQVVSIEASSDHYAVLCRNWRLDPKGWVCLHLAVGDHPGMVAMTRGLAGLDHVLPQTSARGDGIEFRPMLTLDCINSIVGHPRIDVMKIDVEGMELSVLKGAQGLLEGAKIGLIVLECDGHDARYGSNNHELVAFLASKNYQLNSGASEVGRERANFQVFSPARRDC